MVAGAAGMKNHRDRLVASGDDAAVYVPHCTRDPSRFVAPERIVHGIEFNWKALEPLRG